MCITDGILRANLDGELTPDESLAVDNHLQACADCRRRVEILSAQAEQVSAFFSALAPSPGEASVDARVALTRFRVRQSHSEGEKVSMLSKLFTRQLRPAWGALIVVALVAACTTLAPMRAWAEKVLGLLRINKVAVISVDTNQLKFNEGQFGRQVGQLLSDTVVVTKEPREPQRVASVDEASQQAGFKVRVFSARADEPELLVQQGTAFHMTLDRARLQAIIDSVGDTHLSLPDSIDGATVSVDVPRSVSAAYGERPTSHGGANAYTEWDQYIHFMQIPTPTVITPPDFNIAEVAVIGLQLLGMSAAEARDFSQTVDWTSTLVVPIPMGVTRHETVDVDGVKGTLITENQRGRRPAKYVLLWVKDGIIYSLMGYGDFSQAVTLANSLE